MKTLSFIGLLALTVSTDFAGPAETNAMLELPGSSTVITAESAVFSLGTNKAVRGVYYGRVDVDDPRIKLTCAQLTVDLPPSGAHVSHILCQTNVVIDFRDDTGRTNHATGDQAVYDYHVAGAATNETFTLTGQPEVENAEGKQLGDEIVFDLVKQTMNVTNPTTIVPQRNLLGEAPAGTNSAAANTNEPAALKKEKNPRPNSPQPNSP
ncbi:MAG: LptA/OstA family protein [Verrucomicrobiota bacterium]|jgi:lipopolysaccharide export system protein LptA